MTGSNWVVSSSVHEVEVAMDVKMEAASEEKSQAVLSINLDCTEELLW